MLLANLLINTTGRPGDSYVTIDVMRLPLGVLTGVGFIGAGAILQKGNVIQGVTTAATLWFSTVMGFCFGAGEYGLGVALLGLAGVVLWGLRWVENHWWHRVEAAVSVTVADGKHTSEEIIRLLREAGYMVSPVQAEWAESKTRYRYNIHRHSKEESAGPPLELVRLAEQGDIGLTWSRNP